MLGGVTIEHDRGLDGHSDADVVCHALIDAVLGASALGDIGDLFLRMIPALPVPRASSCSPAHGRGSRRRDTSS